LANTGAKYSSDDVKSKLIKLRYGFNFRRSTSTTNIMYDELCQIHDTKSIIYILPRDMILRHDFAA